MGFENKQKKTELVFKNWKRVFIKLTDDRFKEVRNVLAIRKPRKLDHYNLRYLANFTRNEQLKMLETYARSGGKICVFF